MKHPRTSAGVLGGVAGAIGLPGVAGSLPLAAELAAGGALGAGLVPEKGLSESALNIGLRTEEANLATAERAFKAAAKESEAAGKQLDAHFNESPDLVPKDIVKRAHK